MDVTDLLIFSDLLVTDLSKWKGRDDCVRRAFFS